MWEYLQLMFELKFQQIAFLVIVFLLMLIVAVLLSWLPRLFGIMAELIVLVGGWRYYYNLLCEDIAKRWIVVGHMVIIIFCTLVMFFFVCAGICAIRDDITDVEKSSGGK